jgi:hypothetical protein
MLDLEPIKKRLAAATPGPWAWREDMFRLKYMQQLKNGQWRAKPGKSANSSWVMLLTGPMRAPRINFTEENILCGYPDEWDFPHIIALRWSDIKGKSLVNVAPSRADAELIANAPNDIAALIEEVEKLREKLREKGP